MTDRADLTLEEQVAGLAALREPFPPETIGKLPRITCQACSKRQCQKHAPARCEECGNWITTQHIHLDYVGHAATTDRLRQIDPFWNWEPFALDDRGLPLIVDGQLWIRLTVCGVTRIGVGDGRSDKERIGDAIRNAAMRFGVALDLWAKEDLRSDESETDSTLTHAPNPDVTSKNALLEAVGGDKARAAAVWAASSEHPMTVGEWEAIAATIDLDAVPAEAEVVA